MTSHVFGYSPSPAVATFGLRKTVEHAESDVRDFVVRDFYVDDALTSTDDDQSAISLMKSTQTTLMGNGNIELHKVTSNSETVLQAFPIEDLSTDVKSLDLQSDYLPLQRNSFGIFQETS